MAFGSTYRCRPHGGCRLHQRRGLVQPGLWESAPESNWPSRVSAVAGFIDPETCIPHLRSISARRDFGPAELFSDGPLTSIRRPEFAQAPNLDVQLHWLSVFGYSYYARCLELL